MKNINLTHACLALAVVMLLIWRLWAALLRFREGRTRAFQRKLETVLLPKESIKAVCPQGKRRYILTSRRLLTETKTGFTALDLKDIKSVHGTNEAGNRTTVPEKMVQFTIRANGDLILKNTGAEFEDLAKQLSDILKKRREKAKKK